MDDKGGYYVPLFSGEGLNEWIAWVEKFFTVHEFHGHECLNFAQAFIEDEPLSWYYNQQETRPFQTWEELKVGLRGRFGEVPEEKGLLRDVRDWGSPIKDSDERGKPKSVYQSLVEMFPRVDARILRAVAIEHPKDFHEAVGVVLSEIIPCLPSDLTCNTVIAQPLSKSPRSILDDEGETLASSSGTIPPVVYCGSDTGTALASHPRKAESNQTDSVALHQHSKCSSDPYEVKPQHQAESSTSSGTTLQKLVDLNPGEHATMAEEFSGSSNIAYETSNGSVTSENDDAALVDRPRKACSIDHLEEIIEDAKSNKKTLFTVMESVMNLMREVEIQEKHAEKAKEESARGGIDTLNKVEELKKMLEHAREANDMHAGEVYGEKSILATEVKELESRLVNLSEERNKSLCILDEMRERLEARLAEALEMRKAAEQEKREKEENARKALSEQEEIMGIVVRESKLLQQETEENLKLREFLMDRGQIVDSLQGEISVICQDIRLLKEKFDQRIPLSESISSTHTSCRLASSASSMVNLLEKTGEQFDKKPMTVNHKESPSASSYEETGEKEEEAVEEGWDIC